MATIPKIIHQIWIGPKPPPSFMAKWKELNSEYEYILWDNERIKDFKIKNIYLYNLYSDHEECWNARSDILRYEILEQYGGVYIDADCMPLRPLENRIVDNEFFTCYINEKKRNNRLASGILGSIRGHVVLRRCISEIRKIRTIGSQQAWELIGPCLFTKVASQYLELIKVYPSYYFIPDFFDDSTRYKGNFQPFCYHYWGNTKKIYDKLASFDTNNI